MLGLLSPYVSVLRPRDLGFLAVDMLWKFLKDKDPELHRKFVPKFLGGHVLFS